MIVRAPAARLALTLALLLAACGGAGDGPREDPGTDGPREIPIGDRFTTEATLTLEPADGEAVTLDVAVADTGEERQLGLMNVEELPEGTGMVFLRDEPEDADFWMKNTLIPLSVAVWDESGTIREIVDMDPCNEDPCTVYDIGEPWIGAVEVDQGFFEEQGIAVGATATLER